jgi:predicted acylesterase/phospholipase RssA
MAIRSGLRFVDLLVEPAVDHVRMHEYHRHRELIAAGYDAAKAALPGLGGEASAAQG